jgi:hypothetical protein
VTTSLISFSWVNILDRISLNLSGT